MSESKTRKAVTTLSMVNSAWKGFKDALKGLDVDTSAWRLVQPVTGGFEILGTNVPESVPLVYGTKEGAYNTFITWNAVITLVQTMSGQSVSVEAVEATVNPDTGETPESKPATPKRRRVAAAA